MSEKLYALLLRLYPAGFRRVYGEEALQLLRDRMRDERGLLLRLRLWCDLIGDLALSLPAAHRAQAIAVAASQAEPLWDGVPGFRTLENEALSARSLLYGGLASVVVYTGLLILVSHGGRFLHTMDPDLGQVPRALNTLSVREPDIELSYSPSAPGSGTMVHLVARVSVAGGAYPTGKVRFYDLTTVLADGELVDGQAVLTVRLPTITKHLLRATYLGDSRYGAVSSTQRTR